MVLMQCLCKAEGRSACTQHCDFFSMSLDVA